MIWWKKKEPFVHGNMRIMMAMERKKRLQLSEQTICQIITFQIIFRVYTISIPLGKLQNYNVTITQCAELHALFSIKEKDSLHMILPLVVLAVSCIYTV